MRSLSVASRAAVVVSCGSLLSCATADVIRLEQTRRSPGSLAGVQVLMEEPSRPYTAIAIVNVDDHGLDRGFEALKSKLVRVAAAEGGDAVIIRGQSRDARGAVLVPFGGALHGVPLIRRTMVGKVIAFTDN